MKFDKPKFVSTAESYQKAPGSLVVNGGVLNCNCGSLKNTVKLVVEDRGSDAGGSPICMDTDREAKNFSQHFGKCAKTGEDCSLASMNKKWHILAKVPAYIKWIPKPKPRGKYTVEDTNLVTPVTIYPVILESSLICWHNGSAGLITIEKNGQRPSNDIENYINPLTGTLTLPLPWTIPIPSIPSIFDPFIIAPNERNLWWLYGSEYPPLKGYEKNTEHDESKEQGIKGKPNSYEDYRKGEELIKRRYFGPDGKWEVDHHFTDHGNPKQHPDVPHGHDVKWVEGRPEFENTYSLPDYNILI